MEIVINAVKQGHKSGWEKANKNMPVMDINELIKIIVPVFQAKDGKKEAVLTAAKALAEKYKKPIDDYINAFPISFIEDSLKQIKFRNVSDLGTEQFAKEIMKASKNVEKAVEDYCHSSIDEIELIKRVYDSGFLMVAQQFVQVAGVNIAEVKNQIQTAIGDISGASILLISFTASAAAYKMLREALQSAADMHEERIRVEEECNKSIAMMRQYREQMNSALSDYLFVRAESFNAGVAAMNQAIIDNDVDGFIQGNTVIQEILNYNIQFRNQKEFDALMDSDMAFTL